MSNESVSEAFKIAGLVGSVILATIGVFGWYYAREAAKDSKAKADEEKRQAAVSIAEAQKSAAVAYEQAAKANENTVHARLELERTRLEVEQLREKNRPRILSEAQAKIFLDAVRDAPKGKVVFSASLEGEDTLPYAQSLRELFVSAGYDVSEKIPRLLSTLKGRSVSVGVKNPASVPAYVAAAVKGMELADFAKGTFAVEQKGDMENILSVVVHPKPMLETPPSAQEK